MLSGLAFCFSFFHTKLTSLQGPEQDSVHLTEQYSTKGTLILYPINSSRLLLAYHQALRLHMRIAMPDQSRCSPTGGSIVLVGRGSATNQLCAQGQITLPQFPFLLFDCLVHLDCKIFAPILCLAQGPRSQSWHLGATVMQMIGSYAVFNAGRFQML